MFSAEDAQLGGQGLALADLLAAFTDSQPSITKNKYGGKCPNCGLTYSSFKSSGRLGCSECYEAFRNELVPLLGRLQGSTGHVGKAPHTGKKKKGIVKNPINPLK